jgi:hypothetical protein
VNRPKDRPGVHDGPMNAFQFTASLVASLSWPLVALCAIVILRLPLSDLITRVRLYKGMGQEVTFGDRLAAAESSVEQAMRSSDRLSKDRADHGAVPGPLVREAEQNPSFVVISAWEQVQDALGEVFAAAFPEEEKRRSEPLSDLQKKRIASPEYFTAVRSLRDLRNRVAHGQANPTPGEAITYAESASELASAAKVMAHALRAGK